MPIEISAVHPVLMARDVSESLAFYAEFVSAGAVTTASTGGPYATPADTPWGTREFHLRDPGGNVLQFAQGREG